MAAYVVGDRAHQPDPATAVHQPEPALGQERAECARRNGVRGPAPAGGAAEDADPLHSSTLPEVEQSVPVADRPRRPEWMKVRAPSQNGSYFDVKKLIHGARLKTICEEARCPNIAGVGAGTATFRSSARSARLPLLL
jgi:hypothetical protein